MLSSVAYCRELVENQRDHGRDLMLPHERIQIARVAGEPLAIFRDPVQDIIIEIPGDTQPDRCARYQQFSDRADPCATPKELRQADRRVVLAHSRGQKVVEAYAIDHEIRLQLGYEAPSDAHDVLALRPLDAGIDNLDAPSAAQQALELTRISKAFLNASAIGQAVPEHEHPE